MRRNDLQKLLELTKRMRKALKRFGKEAPALQARYREAMGGLTGRENWARLYES